MVGPSPCYTTYTDGKCQGVSETSSWNLQARFMERRIATASILPGQCTNSPGQAVTGHTIHSTFLAVAATAGSHTATWLPIKKVTSMVRPMRAEHMVLGSPSRSRPDSACGNRADGHATIGWLAHPSQWE